MFGYDCDISAMSKSDNLNALTLIATGMRRDEVRDIPNNVVHHDPAIVLFVMLFDLFDRYS